jgi:hypothetical protein
MAQDAWDDRHLDVRKNFQKMDFGTGIITGVMNFKEFVEHLDLPHFPFEPLFVIRITVSTCDSLTPKFSPTNSICSPLKFNFIDLGITLSFPLSTLIFVSVTSDTKLFINPLQI